jgi:hypothetical protein
MLPFTSETLKVTILLMFLVIGFYFWEFPFNAYLNIFLKSLAIGVVYVIIIYKLNVSGDISAVIRKYLRLKR